VRDERPDRGGDELDDHGAGDRRSDDGAPDAADL
jgi:hypothetical protein